VCMMGRRGESDLEYVRTWVRKVEREECIAQDFARCAGRVDISRLPDKRAMGACR
jgi:hypothetical protein